MDEEEELYPEERSIRIIADGTKLTGRDMELLTRYCYNTFSEDNREDPAGWFLNGFRDRVRLLDNGCIVTNDGLILRYLGDGGEVVLDDSITGIGRYAFDYYGKPRKYDLTRPGEITSINIPKSVKYIGEYAFQNQNSIESITVPASVKEFGNYAFAGMGIKKIIFEEGIRQIPVGICDECRLLETVVLPKSLEKIGKVAFRYCTSFDIDIYSGFEDLPNLTEIGGGAFYNCIMKDFVIPEQITKIGANAFYLNGDYGREPEEAKITVMGDAKGYETGFCNGLAIPVFTKGIAGVKLGLRIWTYNTEPDKDKKMLIGCKWLRIGDIDGYEYEASVNEDFSNSVRIETTEPQGKVYADAGKSEVTTLYARVRAFRTVDDKGTREYTEWSEIVWDID